MTRKNKKSQDGDPSQDPAVTNLASERIASKASKNKEAKASQPSTSALIICRNKHWRYISSFHGPWLQLPPEVLESLANNNYNLPLPRPIDPAVFFDLVKIRRLVDDATNLTVRAASGVASSSIQNSINAGNGLLGNAGAALGLGLGGGGGNAKLSRERKHRMREQATQKLSKAYHLDEIACSVATMQSASSLEDVAHLVLQRSPLDADAKYVHFFHEKIPSRQLAECTSLQPLDEIIADRPSDGEPLRTRAVTKIFKDNYIGAAQDLTAALQLCRYRQSQHRADRQQLQLASVAAAEAQRNGRWKEEAKLGEEDHPSSLETQLLFHRAAVYLTIACQHVSAALPTKSHTSAKVANGINEVNCTNVLDGETLVEEDSPTPAEQEAQRRRFDARKVVKANAKRALRDYIAFLSHFDYTPGLPTDITEEFVRKVNQAANGFQSPMANSHSKIFDMDSNSPLSNNQSSDALVPHIRPHRHRHPNGSSRLNELPNLPPPVIYQISSLFSATPPADLPPYPETSNTLAIIQNINRSQSSQTSQAFLTYTQAERHEALTYHPLLTDALHSLLLCHCLIQTSARELQRHAHMVARLARICDGYPIFQAARSPSRADWIEVVRRGDNWINLSQSWESLCTPAPLPGQASSSQQKETQEQRHERLKQQAIMEALEDDRVHDEASFHAAVQARERRQQEEEERAHANGHGNGNGPAPKRWAQEDGKEYPISTERADAIVKWLRDVPIGSNATGTRKKKKGAKGAAKRNDLEEEMAGMKLEDGNESFEPVEEEVD